MTARKDGHTVLTHDDVLELVTDALGLWHGAQQAAVIAETVVADLEAEGAQYDGWVAS